MNIRKVSVEVGPEENIFNRYFDNLSTIGGWVLLEIFIPFFNRFLTVFLTEKTKVTKACKIKVVI